MEGITILSTSECVATPNWVIVMGLVGMIVMFSSLVITVKSDSNYFNIVLCVVGIIFNYYWYFWQFNH